MEVKAFFCFYKLELYYYVGVVIAANYYQFIAEIVADTKLVWANSCRCTFPGMPDEQREGLQEELIDIILRVLKRNPQLHYYQGYHDIVVTFLLVLGERLATALVEKLSTHHLRYLLEK